MDWFGGLVGDFLCGEVRLDLDACLGVQGRVVIGFYVDIAAFGAVVVGLLIRAAFRAAR